MMITLSYGVKVKPDVSPHPTKNGDKSGSKGTVFPFPCNGAEGGT